MKVLVAEDDFISCKAIEESLEDWGYEVVLAKNGEEAWQALKKDMVHIAIFDWMMDGMDGVELCQKIRHEYKEDESSYIYIIMLSGKDNENDIIKGLEAGADDFITKPFNPLDLKVSLQNGERIIELEDKRIKLERTDGLTELWSQKKIYEFLEEELARGSRENYPTGIIILDIDHFKKINRTYGFAAGDSVLVEAATRLKRNIRCYDKIGRNGRDEMLIILTNCTSAKVEKVAERVRHIICEKEIKTPTDSLNITISLGCASTESMIHASADDLIQASSKALSAAKKQGGNCYVIAELKSLPSEEKQKRKTKN